MVLGRTEWIDEGKNDNVLVDKWSHLPGEFQLLVKLS